MSEQEKFNFATIGQVYEDGVSLIFDGQEEPSQKHYKVNTSIRFSPGDRVKILSACGTYIVEYIVGNPLTGTESDDQQEQIVGLPSGGSQGQCLQKNSETDFDASWKDSFELPAGGSLGYVLGKNSSDEGDVGWRNAVPYLIDANSANASRIIGFRYVSGTGFQIRGSSTSWLTLSLE